MLSILIPGLVGGLILALLLRRFRTGTDDLPARLRLEPPSPGLINMARIRVGGSGGLGLFAMALAVAWYVPRIRAEMTVGLILGVILAAGLILWRRRRGPLTSSGDGHAAHTMLGLDNGSRHRSAFDEHGHGSSRRLATVHPR